MSEPAAPDAPNPNAVNQVGSGDRLLFWACFISLIATAFGFVIRGQVISEWGMEFGLSKTQQGEILGVGLWPFAISIVLFSFIIDKIGYGKAMIFAFACHIVSTIVLIFATGYWSLYVGTLILSLGNGTVEAVVNPVVATLFPREKTKWLNILHAGWPGGLVLGGLLGMAFADSPWEVKVGLVFLPTVLYGVLMLGRKFPVQERVAAGVSYMDMLKEVGGVGAFLVIFLICGEMLPKFGVGSPILVAAIIGLVGGIGYGMYVKSPGRPLFIFLMLIMVPLAITELGVDSWVTPLMEERMKELGLEAVLVLVYTSLIMMILRFFAGPIVHKLSPLGLLCISSVLAACGLVFLSSAAGAMILLAATVYGVGKTFFWPTMLGVAAEQFPKGGALTLNTLAAVGMLGVGVIGNPLLGYLQDTRTVAELEADHPDLLEEVRADEEKTYLFGKIKGVDESKVTPLQLPAKLYEIREDVKEDNPENLAAALEENGDYKKQVYLVYQNFVRDETEAAAVLTSYEDQLAAVKTQQVTWNDKEYPLFWDEETYNELAPKGDTIAATEQEVKQETLRTTAILPCIMLLCYLVLVGYFWKQGGYQADVLTGHAANDDEFTGGTEGPSGA